VLPARLDPPTSDPTPIFDAFRGNFATELLTAAVSHFNLFSKLANAPLTLVELLQQLALAERPTVVLLAALRGLGLIIQDKSGKLALSDVARAYLVSGSGFDITGYVGLAADNPGVLEIVQRLRSNSPAGNSAEQPGAAFIYREGIESAMEDEAAARRLTLALAGRARIVAPVLAERYPLSGATRLLDVGGGTGLFSIAWLQRHAGLRAVVWDRPEVLKVAREMAEGHGVAGRLEGVPGDMFTDPVPPGCDVVLLSNVLHDWDIPECRALIRRLAECLPRGGRLLIHDVFLDDDLGGPLSVALYSAALFSLTEGRAYSAAEYRTWLVEAGLAPEEIMPTMVHCGVLPAFKHMRSNRSA
jgi:SAM-dependent methyltransferase